jgi:serine acetyltransferase
MSENAARATLNTVSTNHEPLSRPACRHDLRYSWSCLRADWPANNSAISKLVLVIHRFGHLLSAGYLPPAVASALWPLYRTLDLVWAKLLAGAELPPGLCVGPGLYLAHGGRGTVLSDGVVLGANVALYHQSSVGRQDTSPGLWPPPPVPVVEDGARIGTGARVMGGVRVGAGALVGANAVVFTDVPAGSTMAGNPARLLTPPQQAPVET